MTKYVAFLRGINVGGNKKVNMSVLKETLEKLGYEHVKILLNSGNIIFETVDKDIVKLTKAIATKLQQVFGFEIPVIIRTIESLRTLADTEPFKDIEVTPETRLYITFLGDPPAGGLQSSLKIPYTSAQGNFTILKVTEREIISVLTVTSQFKTTEVMNVIEKEWGKNVTTRNWNTIEKVLKTAA